MSHAKYTLVYDRQGVRTKLFKIFYGRDGSYYVTSPYHPEQKAALLKMRINYALAEFSVADEELVEVASADDDQRRIKLAHHPDGFVQFSGQGILSGREPDGTIRGIGVTSWPLERPFRGPAFGVVMSGVEQFAPYIGDASDTTIIIAESSLTTLQGAQTLVVEGYYFPERWRRFVRTDAAGIKSLDLVHPAGVVLGLRVLLPPVDCELQGFIGSEAYTIKRTDEDLEAPRFAMSSAAGEGRMNLEGQYTAANIHCTYPRIETMDMRRSVNYRLDEVPPGGIDPQRLGRSPTNSGAGGMLY